MTDAPVSTVADCRVLVLAGGYGTRLRAVVPDRPKVLAPVGGRPFLDILVALLYGRGVRRIALLLGHLHEQVERHVEDVLRPRHPDIDFAWSVEPVPLGTAGALRHAQVQDGLACETFLLANGDTYCELDPAALLAAHRATGAIVTMATHAMPDSRRYGTVEAEPDGRVRAFREKEPQVGTGAGGGMINAGVYVIEPRLVERIPGGRAVALESEVFPALLAAGERIQAVAQSGHFADIGTAESYAEFGAFLKGTGA